jgi:hypothetical protein
MALPSTSPAIVSRFLGQLVNRAQREGWKYWKREDLPEERYAFSLANQADYTVTFLARTTTRHPPTWQLPRALLRRALRRQWSLLLLERGLSGYLLRPGYIQRFSRPFVRNGAAIVTVSGRELRKCCWVGIPFFGIEGFLTAVQPQRSPGHDLLPGALLHYGARHGG